MIAARFDPAGIHHRADVVHPGVQIGDAGVAVGEAGSALVEQDQPAERREPREKSAAGPSQATSSAEKIQPFTNTRSIGASPTTEYAMLTSPLFAYRTSGASTATVSVGRRGARNACA
jgi:hypothetical protein